MADHLTEAAKRLAHAHQTALYARNLGEAVPGDAEWLWDILRKGEKEAYLAAARAVLPEGSVVAPREPAKPLAEGHRDDFYLLRSARSIASRAHQRRPNWALAMDLFLTGSTMAHRICKDAGIDPDGYTVERIKEDAR